MNMTDDDKICGRGLDRDSNSEHEDCEKEAEFEATPRISKWGESEKGDLHYLLPLKGKHGRLIQQEPTIVPMSPPGNADSLCNPPR